jgi:Kef-type K+ transport system membrane component KefB
MIPSLAALAIVVVTARAGGLLAGRCRQPVVLGELAAGVLLGNLALAGVSGLEYVKTDAAVDLLSRIAIGVLLFQVGLESTVGELRRVGLSASLVAICGIGGSCVAGTVAARALLPSAGAAAQLFIGAALAATSVGVTARVLKDIGQARSPSAHVILGAAVVDDVIGLILVAIVGARSLQSNAGVFVMSAVAAGSFAAGLVINEATSRSIDRRIMPIASWVVPVFFAVMGLRADLSGLAKPAVLALAAALTLAAIIGKQCCALGVVSSHTRADRIAVGLGMMPRGEVTLIFASLGQTMALIDPDTFLALVITVIATTMITPAALKWRLARAQ